jgi:hypothetical protein
MSLGDYKPIGGELLVSNAETEEELTDFTYNDATNTLTIDVVLYKSVGLSLQISFEGEPANVNVNYTKVIVFKVADASCGWGIRVEGMTQDYLLAEQLPES